MPPKKRQKFDANQAADLLQLSDEEFEERLGPINNESENEDSGEEIGYDEEEQDIVDEGRVEFLANCLTSSLPSSLNHACTHTQMHIHTRSLTHSLTHSFTIDPVNVLLRRMFTVSKS